MNDTSSSWCNLPKRVYMSHYIMSPPLLLFRSDLEVLLGQIKVGLHLSNCLIGDGQTELLLRLRKPYPQLAPCAEAGLVGEKLGHFWGGIARGQRGLVDVVVGHFCVFLFELLLDDLAFFPPWWGRRIFALIEFSTPLEALRSLPHGGGYRYLICSKIYNQLLSNLIRLANQ